MTHVAPRIVNNVSGVKRINDECYFSWQAQYLVKFKCHFVAGAVFCEVQVSLFVAGAVFREVQVSLFVAGAVFGEIWNDSQSAKCCIFQYKMLVLGVKSNLGCEAGCGLTVSWSHHARIMVGSFSDRPRIGNNVSSVFSKFL